MSFKLHCRTSLIRDFAWSAWIIRFTFCFSGKFGQILVRNVTTAVTTSLMIYRHCHESWTRRRCRYRHRVARVSCSTTFNSCSHSRPFSCSWVIMDYVVTLVGDVSYRYIEFSDQMDLGATHAAEFPVLWACSRWGICAGIKILVEWNYAAALVTSS